MTNTLVEVGDATISPLKSIGVTILENAPGIIGALIVIVIGYLIGLLIGHLIYKLLKNWKIDNWVIKNNLSKVLLNLKLSIIIKYMITWGIFIVFLAPAASLIKINVLTEILTSLAFWIPNLILAIIITIIGLIVSEIIARNIKASKNDNINNFFSKLIQIVIIIVILSIALDYIGLNMKLLENILLIVLAGIVLAFSIAIGVGFGKSLKVHSDKIIKKTFIEKKK